MIRSDSGCVPARQSRRSMLLSGVGFYAYLQWILRWMPAGLPKLVDCLLSMSTVETIRLCAATDGASTSCPSAICDKKPHSAVPESLDVHFSINEKADANPPNIPTSPQL
ncbi:MAG: hypothetical protein NT172_17740 [Planctomycetota bacterium]|nr:hypothetical protein [Planctomycetota bacterium]